MPVSVSCFSLSTICFTCRNVADIIAREGSDLGRNFARNAAKGLKAHPSRVYDVATLKKVKGCGGAVAGVSVTSLAQVAMLDLGAPT